MNGRPKTVRCAIYTRKSTEHNLDLEFNSLHAQREACEAYIKSQLHEGWQLISDHYDDGAFSGASLERPDLQRLLADIATGRVDNVVVYKVDRLTRSLTDFAKLVELFDRHGVSFVSVTQSFNTTTSMGRLTLNVLLSFAQFEREVIGERVRDKIAASKKKGLFMGGNIPLGYINRDKKLVIVSDEAEKVRSLFQRYLQLGSLGRLLEEMSQQGIRTKVLTLANGKKRGGVPYGKGALAYLLKNRCYVGEILHKGQIHPGEHEAIVERATFDAVQASLAGNVVARKTKAKASPFLLQGLLFDSAGNKMTPSHSRKKGVRYRYYISQAVLQSRKADAGQVFRVPAPDIEAVIERFLRDRSRNLQGDLRASLEAQVSKITNLPDSISVELAAAPENSPDAGSDRPRQVVSLPWAKKPFRAAKGPTIDSGLQDPAAGDPRAKDIVLTAIGKAQGWLDALLAGKNVAELASHEGCTERYLRVMLQLAFVSPRLVQAIADGSMPPGLTATRLSQALPRVWLEQERLHLLA
jgi:site-specific DNA recombinase